MLRVNEYVNTVQNDTNNGWDDGATNDDSGAEQSAPSLWDDVKNTVGRIWEQDVYGGIIKPFAEGAEQAFGQIAAANNQQANAITQSVEDLGGDSDTQAQDMQQIEDASNYRYAAGKEALNGPAMLVPQIAAPVFVGDAINTAIDEGSVGAGVRAVTYGPLTDFASQENLGDRFIEQPITTTGQAVLSALPIGVAGHLGYKGVKGAKARYTEGMTDFEKQLSDLGEDTYNAPDAAEPIRENEPQEAYTEQTADATPEEAQPEAPQQQAGGVDTGIDSGIDSMVNDAAARNGVDPALLAKLVDQESTYGRDPNAGGNLAQVSDDLAAHYGLDNSDPAQSIEAGARYLKEQLDANGGDAREALAAYNAGPGNKQAGYGYADSVLGRDIGGDIGQSGGSAGGAYEQGAESWMGARMPSGSEGCVEAATRVGSFYDPFLKEEADRGVASVPRLVEDAGDRVIPFDESQLEKGDIIVYGDNDHVVTYDGRGGYVGNSTGQGKIVHGSDYHEMGNMSPTKIIKTSDHTGGNYTSPVDDSYSDAITQEENGRAAANDENVDILDNKLNDSDVPIDEQMRQDVQSVVDNQFANINKPADIKWDEPAGNNMTLYRGEQGNLDNGRHLSRQQTVYDVLGRKDPNAKEDSSAPVTYYTESPEDAKAYSNTDQRILQGMRENVGDNAEGTFKTLFGHDAREEGKVNSYNVDTGKVLDLSDLGENPSYKDMEQRILDTAGIKRTTTADSTHPDWELIDDRLKLSDMYGDEDNAPAYMILKNNPHESINRANEFIDFARENGYDSIKYKEDGANHYAVIKKPSLNESMRSDAKNTIESIINKEYGKDNAAEETAAPKESHTRAVDSAIEQLKQKRQQMIDEQVQFYKDTPGGKGTDSAPIYDEYGERSGTVNVSNNPQWYQDAYDYFGGKPPKNRLAEFAEQDLMTNDENFGKLDLQIRRMEEYSKRLKESPDADPNEVAKSVADDIRYSHERIDNKQGESNPPDNPPDAQTDGTITMRQIYKHAQELFTTIRTGRMRSGGGHRSDSVLGQYSPDTDVVRARTYGDLRTIAHELGHALDERLNLSGSPAYNAEFAKVVNERFGKGAYKPQEIPGEGVAEFMHDYLQNPAEAKKNFPNFYKKFMEKMDSDPKNFAKVEEMRDMVQKYNGQSAEARGRSAVSYGYENEPSAMEKLKNSWHSFIEGVVDDKDALQRAQESYNRLTGKVADTAHDVYKQARLAMNSSMARAQMMVEGKKSSLIRNTLNKIYGDVAGENFHTIKEILSTLDKSVKGKYDDYLKRGGYQNWHEALDSLLVARRSIEIKDTRIREAQDAQADIEFRAADIRKKLAGLENTKKALDRAIVTDAVKKQTAKVSRAIDNLKNQLKTLAHDHAAAVENVKQAKAYKTAMTMDDARAISKNAPEELTRAARDVYRYNDTVLHIMQKTGMISDKTYNVLHEKYHNYVPLARDFADEAGIIKGFGMGGDGFANVAKALKNLSDTGSTRQVKSPLESMVDNTYKLLSMAERNKVGQIFASWAKTKGAGKLIEPVVGTAKSKDSTFKVWIDGKEHVYATTPELYRAITSMNRETSNIITKLLSPPAGLLRSGATLMPDFALKNIMRDAFGAAVFSRYGFRPIIDHATGIFHMIRQDQLFQDYKASGALMSTMVGMDRDFVQASLKGLYKKNASYYWKNYNPVQILRGFSEMLETATRLGEYNRAVKKGVSMDDAALSARDVSLDFSKAGTYGRTINKVSAFFNAAVQEPARIFQAFKEKPKETAVKTALYITLPSVALWTINHNQEWYKELPEYQKNIFWCFKAGDAVYRIPKPFGLGVMFGSLPERALDYAYNKNPQSLKKWLEAAKDAFLPNLAPTAIVPIIEWMSNYSFFRGRSIVPGRLEKMPDSMQYGPNTSNMAKDIGKMFNLSPMKIDNLIRGYGAGMATQSLNAWDAVQGDRPMDNPFKKAFTVDPLQSPQSVQDFYDKMDEAEKAYNGAGGKAKATGSVSYNYQLMQHANKVMQDLNKQERVAVQAHDQSKIDAINAKQLKAAQDALKLYK